MWAFRPDERHGRERRGRPESTPGIVVILPRGERFFFPGGDPTLGMIAARRLLEGSDQEQQLDHPHTRIEFGTACGRSWTCEKVLKAPATG